MNEAIKKLDTQALLDTLVFEGMEMGRASLLEKWAEASRHRQIIGDLQIEIKRRMK